MPFATNKLSPSVVKPCTVNSPEIVPPINFKYVAFASAIVKYADKSIDPDPDPDPIPFTHLPDVPLYIRDCPFVRFVIFTSDKSFNAPTVLGPVCIPKSITFGDTLCHLPSSEYCNISLTVIVSISTSNNDCKWSILLTLSSNAATAFCSVVL